LYGTTLSVLLPLLRCVRAPLAAFLTSDAELAELAALCSEPGAKDQPLHPDTQYAGAGAHCALITAFVALQDVRPDMGPTEVVPGSHVRRVLSYAGSHATAFAR
jgi:ectoine hydroxylase-related dioxygenase (phytanoyl-CoA dioxygenase family)